jgi:hypothetical protein
VSFLVCLARLKRRKFTIFIFSTLNSTPAESFLHSQPRLTFGYYKYSKHTIWIIDDLFASQDIRNIGFIIRKDPRIVSRDHFTASLIEIFSTIEFTEADSLRYHEAKEALPFDGPIPKFQLRTSSSIFHNSALGKVKTTALTVHCNQKHVELLAPLFIKFYETGKAEEQFVPHSLLHGND